MQSLFGGSSEESFNQSPAAALEAPERDAFAERVADIVLERIEGRLPSKHQRQQRIGSACARHCPAPDVNIAGAADTKGTDDYHAAAPSDEHADTHRSEPRTARRPEWESVWLAGESEFEKLLDDKARVEALVEHLQATQANYEHHDDIHHRTPFFALKGRALREACEWLKRQPDGSSGRWRTLWDLLLVILLLAALVLMPLQLAFVDDLVRPWDAPPPTPWQPWLWLAVNLGIDALLGVDVFVSLLTPFAKEDGAIVVTEPRQVVAHNMARTLPIDIVCAFPADLTLRCVGAHGLQRLGLAYQLVRVLKAKRAMRTVKASAHWRQLITSTHPAVLPLTELLVSMVLGWHWLACFWWFIVTHDGTSAEHHAWWFVDPTAAEGALSTANFSAYGVAMYWAMITTSGLGNPLATLSGWAGAMEAIATWTGVGMQTYIFGTAAAAIGSVDEVKNKRLRRLEAVRNFVRLRRVPPFVGRRVIEYYEHITQRMEPREEAQLLEQLPTTLRLQLAVVLNERFLRHVPMFDQQAMLPRSIALLALVLVQRTYLPDELVLAEGALNDQLHFLRTGKLQVFVRLDEASQAAANIRKHLAEPRRLSFKSALKTTMGAIKERRNSSLALLAPTALLKRQRTSFAPTVKPPAAEAPPKAPEPVADPARVAARARYNSLVEKAKQAQRATRSAFRSKFEEDQDDATGGAQSGGSAQKTVDHHLGVMVATMKEGAVFGEQSFLARTTSQASIRTVGYCDIMSLHRTHMESVFRTDPELREQVSQFRDKQREQYLKKNMEAKEKVDARKHGTTNGKHRSSFSSTFNLGPSGAAGGAGAGRKESKGKLTTTSCISTFMRQPKPSCCSGFARKEPRLPRRSHAPSGPPPQRV